jgi:membrane protease YdiL (CAAX protease family)
MKKWWMVAIVTSVVWAVLVIGAGILHTEVVLKGKLTPAEDEVISGRYGFACGVGMVVIWILSFVIKGRKSSSKP